MWFFYISDRPNVTINCPSSFLVNESSNFSCLCKGENGYPAATVKWIKDGVVVEGPSSLQVTLSRDNVTAADDGTYTCEAESFTLVDEKSIKVKVNLNCKYYMIVSQFLLKIHHEIKKPRLHIPYITV